jgi:hypothetical protein
MYIIYEGVVTEDMCVIRRRRIHAWHMRRRIHTNWGYRGHITG